MRTEFKYCVITLVAVFAVMAAVIMPQMIPVDDIYGDGTYDSEIFPSVVSSVEL